MDASTDSGSTAPTVVFKRKRGPGARVTTTSTSSSTAASSASGGSTAGPSRASHGLSHAASGRLHSDDSDDGASSSAVIIKKKKKRTNNPLVQSTGAVSRKKTGETASDSDDDDYSLESESNTRSGPHYRNRLGDAAAPSESTVTDSLQKIRDDATRHSNWDLESGPSSSSATEPAKGSNSDGIYRGAKGYASYIAARDDGTSSKMRSRGPIRQTTTVRTTSLMDYQPDVCKDYKETGYCGFGDTCKFLHDRSDYLAGWQLDVLPNTASRTRENLLSDPESEEEEAQVPFACLICRKPFTDPVVTRCGHHFCSSCAIQRFAKNSKCFACGAQTGGLFNSATMVLDKMERAKQRKAEARRERNAWKTVGEEDVAITELGADSDDEA